MRKYGNKILLVGCIAAVLFMLLAVGLPHSHGAAAGSHSQNCTACRAQSIQPVVDPIAAASVSPLTLAGMSAPVQAVFCFQNSVVLFQSRAPPSFSR